MRHEGSSSLTGPLHWESGVLASGLTREVLKFVFFGRGSSGLCVGVGDCWSLKQLYSLGYREHRPPQRGEGCGLFALKQEKGETLQATVGTIGQYGE